MIPNAIIDAPEVGNTFSNSIIGSVLGMSIPDIMLPDQLCDLSKNNQLTPEGLLVFAVLEDAIRCVLGAGTGKNCYSSPVRKKERLRVEAERWIFADDTSAALTFDSVCETLGIHADWLRNGIRLHVRKGAKIPRRSPASGMN